MLWQWWIRFSISIFKNISVAELRNLVLLRERRKLSVFNKIVLWLHYFIILALVVAVIAKYISPLLFWLPSFFGLAFPFLFLINVFFIMYWMVQFKSAIIFGLIIFCVSLPTAYRFAQFSFGIKSLTKQLKITSFNSMLFDLYNWKKNKGYPTMDHRKAIEAFGRCHLHRMSFKYKV
jgi:Zn-dependent protease with chaperone function